MSYRVIGSKYKRISRRKLLSMVQDKRAAIGLLETLTKSGDKVRLSLGPDITVKVAKV